MMHKNIQRLLCLLAVLALTLGLLTGCGQNDQEELPAQDTGAVTQEEDAAAGEEQDEADSAETEDAEAEDTETPDAAQTEEAGAAGGADDAQEPQEPEQAQEPQQEGKTHITLTVTYGDETSQDYDITTDADNLMDAIQDQVELGGSQGEFGFYIESVNGVTADYDTDGAYWAIYVNDDYGMYSIDTQPIKDGDRFALVYTVD